MSGLNLDWSSPLFQRTSSRLAGRIPPTSEVLRFFLYNLKGDLLSFRTCRRVTASCEHPGLQPSATPQQQQPSVSIGQVVYPIRVVLTILFQFSVLAFQFAVQQTAGSSRSLTGTHTEPLQEPASLAKANALKKKKKRYKHHILLCTNQNKQIKTRDRSFSDKGFDRKSSHKCQTSTNNY